MPSAQKVSELEDRLWTAAIQRANLLGFQLSQVSEVYLRTLIRAGVQKMEKEGIATLDSEIQTAAVNLETFVSEMAVEAKRLSLFTLHEPTFLYARKRLCPLWPFC